MSRWEEVAQGMITDIVSDCASMLTGLLSSCLRHFFGIWEKEGTKNGEGTMSTANRRIFLINAYLP